jgi:hypothetical protein
MNDESPTPKLMLKLMKIMDECETMETVDESTLRFHLDDGTIMSMKLSVEHHGGNSTRH